MKKTILFGIMSLLLTSNLFAQAQASGGNSVYIDQTNADNSTVHITQTGSGNQVGDRSDLVTPSFVIDGNSMSLTINQNGMNNRIIGNFIGGDSTATLTQTGSGNIFKLTQGNFGTNGGNLTLTKTGDNNNVEMNMGTTHITNNYLYNLTITGNLNNVVSTMNSKYIENNFTIAGNSNNVTTTQIGAHGSATVVGHKITANIIGDSNAINITQNGTTTPNIITLNVTGSGTTHTIIQH
jgi:hypothetical protein